jgi:hypothetical protein
MLRMIEILWTRMSLLPDGRRMSTHPFSGHRLDLKVGFDARIADKARAFQHRLGT